MCSFHKLLSKRWWSGGYVNLFDTLDTHLIVSFEDLLLFKPVQQTHSPISCDGTIEHWSRWLLHRSTFHSRCGWCDFHFHLIFQWNRCYKPTNTMYQKRHSHVENLNPAIYLFCRTFSIPFRCKCDRFKWYMHIKSLAISQLNCSFFFSVWVFGLIAVQIDWQIDCFWLNQLRCYCRLDLWFPKWQRIETIIGWENGKNGFRTLILAHSIQIHRLLQFSSCCFSHIYRILAIDIFIYV